ncbi:MAG: hypothetical protein Q6368_009250 [Candidatus Baldrarchaeota archaeon]
MRQPSISADETGIIETAEITKGFIDEIGGHSEIVPTDGTHLSVITFLYEYARVPTYVGIDRPT